MTKWPATMLAKRRTVRAKGLVKSPITSTGTMMNQSGQSEVGTPPVRCLRKPSRPMCRMATAWVMTKVNRASITVTDRLAVAVADQGTRPSRFMNRMKKKAVTR